MPHLAHGFPPVETADAHILILGSMPGQASLAAQQYYAHPRNAFWPIMAELLHFDVALPYPLRIKGLQNHGIALWDVLQACQRRGSLDADIAVDSLQINDFPNFLRRHPAIRKIFFNGTTAESHFRKFVAPGLTPGLLSYQRLPSSSPAHAALRFEQKLTAWRVIAP